MTTTVTCAPHSCLMASLIRYVSDLIGTWLRSDFCLLKKSDIIGCVPLQLGNGNITLVTLCFFCHSILDDSIKQGWGISVRIGPAHNDLRSSWASSAEWASPVTHFTPFPQFAKLVHCSLEWRNPSPCLHFSRCLVPQLSTSKYMVWHTQTWSNGDILIQWGLYPGCNCVRLDIVWLVCLEIIHNTMLSVIQNTDGSLEMFH